MPRHEIVRKPDIKVIDDFSGEEIGSNTEPVEYKFGDKTYRLYLSADSRKKVDTWIAELTDGAEQVTGRGGIGVKIKPPYTLADLRKWAKDNGHEVAENRRAKNEVIEAFNSAH